MLVEGVDSVDGVDRVDVGVVVEGEEVDSEVGVEAWERKERRGFLLTYISTFNITIVG